jgi:hypothetical protein
MEELPSLRYEEWRDTRDTLHRWMQIVGKVRLALTPRLNHWWNVPLYVSAHGFTTSTIHYKERWFEIELDFVEDVLRISPNDRPAQIVELRPRTVSDFYAATMAALRAVDIECSIWTMPCEIADAIPFEHDDEHRAYDREYVARFWQNVARISGVLTRFRAGFIGKCSPVHFFWGSFDLAVTRFSGRRSPVVPANAIDREAYSHEVSSVGWWPGDHRLTRAAFYSYAVPEPPGFADGAIVPQTAYFHRALNGWYLDHDDVRLAADPETVIEDFCETTYAAAANLGKWPRTELEHHPQRGAEDINVDLHASRDTRQHTTADEWLRGMSGHGR